MSRIARGSAIVFLAALSSVAVPLAAQNRAPAGWILAGSAPGDYAVASTTNAARSGTVATLASRAVEPEGFGTLMQTIDAAEYRGERLRLSGWVSADQVQSWTGLWMRIDGNDGERTTLAFDNMQNRPIRGSVDWQEYEVVLDVPEEATAIAFGVLLAGPGSVAMDDFRLDAVGLDVPTTDIYAGRRGQPSNLGFEE